MEINKELLARIAANSRIKLSEKEIEEFLPQLKEVLEAFEKLSELNVENVPPSFLPIKPEHKLREDVPKKEESLSNQEALSLTLHKEKKWYRGPRVV